MSTQMVAVDRTGDFRAEIKSYGLQKAESGAVGVRIQAHLVEMFNEETKDWEDWRDYNVEAWGTSWIIKKDGTVNQNAVDALVKYAGWDGSLKTIGENGWVPTPCQVSIGSEEYNGETQFRVSFINAWDRVPGANIGNVTSDDLKALENRFGSSLRAVVGNIKRNTSPPAPANGKGGPKPPPAAKQPAMETVPPAANEDDEIPF
jgi:hypothetical protein